MYEHLAEHLHGLTRPTGPRRQERRSLLMRREEVCERPRESVGRLFEFICSRRGMEEAGDEVVTPDSPGRWRERPAE